MVGANQVPIRFKAIMDDEVSIFKDTPSITLRNSIPDTTAIPIENKTHWFRIPDVICVFVDMVGSTKLSAQKYDQTTARAYRLFTGTAVRLFSEFESPYIDLKGDGVFALFDSGQVHRALAAAVTFKTFAKEEFTPRVQKQTGVMVGCHIGIDQKTVLVRKLGFKRYRGRTDRQNEVWAGRPVNMASKLASISKDNELIVSDRFYSNIKSEKALKSCGCPSGTKNDLWSEFDVDSDEKFDFSKAFLLRSCWCSTHGLEYCDSILKADN
jgi:class 3 adenylate cyclase